MLHFHFQTTNIIQIIIDLLSWGIVIYFIYYFFQKQEKKPKVWKACAATYVGIFTLNFDMDFTIVGEMISIPILPLGVWILYWYASGKKGAWEKYRAYAWLGYKASFIFLAATLIAGLLHNTIYSKHDLTTFISNTDNVTLIHIHPSAEEKEFDSDSFQQHFSKMESEEFNSVDWFNHTTALDPQDRVEQFPYQLAGTKPKWGSGIPTIIYVEQDGKGLLIDSSKGQSYFRGDVSFLKGGDTK